MNAKLIRSARIRFNQIRFRQRTTYPYISGDAIAGLTDYIPFGIDGNADINLEKLSNAKSIFVRGDLLEKLMSKSMHYINAKILVTGNSDHNFLSLPSLPKSIKLWYCQNNALPNCDFVRTLPLGIENLRFGRTSMKDFFVGHDADACVNQVLVPPMNLTNPIRKLVIDQASNSSGIYQISTELAYERNYFKLLRKYRFIFCCEGNGFDTHRLWETLYQGSFPVVLKSYWSISLSYLDLPILFIDSVDSLTESMLIDFLKNHECFDPINSETLWIPKWAEILNIYNS